MILSNNARPIPSFTVERNLTTPFETKWLSWLGPWDLAFLWGYLEDSRAVPNARVVAGRFNFRPRPSLEIGLSGMGLWCGTGRDCGADELFDLVTGSGVTEEFDRLTSLDVRWSGSVSGFPFALYTHWVGEDFSDGAGRKIVPSRVLGQFGAESWGHWERFGSYRFYLEWADTQCDFSLSRKITFNGGGGKPGCAYRNNGYKSGETYRGRSFAHSFDQDSSAITIGGILTDKKDHSWLATAVAGKLNQHGQHKSTVAENETRYAEIEVSHQRKAWIGDLNLGLGFEYREDTDVRAFLEWRFEY